MADDNKAAQPISGLAAKMAVLVIIVWLAGLSWLFFNTDASDATWARWLTVLTAVEAVAFAAAGALFGTEVQRRRVADAQETAEKAEEKAAKNATNAANGRALSEAVKSKAASQPAPAGGIERTSASRGAYDTDELAELARRLFPD